MKVVPKIEESWLSVLEDEFQQAYFAEIKTFLLSEKEANKTIYPPGSQIFNAFNRTPFDKVKVVILGQDPYHGPGQANGLCFSVADGIRQPPSLQNIFKEIQADLGHPIPQSGNLEQWADQGVFLLNAILTVEARKPASHQKIGWQQFTDAVIRKLSEKRENLIFLLWGKFAQNKSELIDSTKHHILKCPHPSPYSAHYGFFGSKHFSKTNEILGSLGLEPINWAL